MMDRLSVEDVNLLMECLQDALQSVRSEMLHARTIIEKQVLREKEERLRRLVALVEKYRTAPVSAP